MSEYGEIETGDAHHGLEATHAEQGAEQDYQSQYGILEQSHDSYEHEEFENVKHIEYTDAAGNHYEVTEYTHYEHTEIESDHTFASYGEEHGSAGFEGAGDSAITAAGVVDTSQDFSIIDTIAERFENFLGSGLHNNNEISDSSA